MPKAIKGKITPAQIIKIPANQAVGGWDFDVDVIREFLEALGIKWDVRIRYSGAKNGGGMMTVKHDENGNWYHHIVISQWGDLEYQNETLIHELIHAMQFERVGVEQFNRDYRKYQRSGKHYLERNPYEVEAESLCKKFAEKWRLLYS